MCVNALMDVALDPEIRQKMKPIVDPFSEVTNEP